MRLIWISVLMLGVSQVSIGVHSVALAEGGEETSIAKVEWVYSKPVEISFARSETTLAQYRACVDAGACLAKHRKMKFTEKYCNWGQRGRDSHPMNCVDWYGAKQFCEWVGGRLPTVKEWEAEASNKGSRKCPWGSEEATCARCVMDDGKTKGSSESNTLGCGEAGSWPVCSKRSGDSVSGLCDMAGNLLEWTSSGEGSTRMVRGGDWGSIYPGLVSATFRSWLVPDTGYGNCGFRCVRQIPNSQKNLSL